MGYPYNQPGPGQPQPAFGQPQPAPSSTTAIFAAIISVSIGVIAAFGTVNSAVYVYGEWDDPTSKTIQAELARIVLGTGVAALLFSLGAILLFRRTTAGRVLVIIASLLGLSFAITQVIHTSHHLDLMLLSLMIAAAPLAALVLAALPSTGRWIAAKPRN
jgi:hypothetical protein